MLEPPVVSGASLDPVDPGAPPSIASPSLGRGAAGGAVRLLISAVSVQLIGLGASVIVARHLAPGDYGTVAVAQTTVAFAQVFGGLGFAPAIASGRLKQAGSLAAAWILLTVSGLVLGVAYLFAAPAIAAGFEIGEASLLLQAAGLSIPISFAGVVPLALLQRELKFGHLGILAVIPQLLAALLAIWLAVAGAGAWALVAPGLAAALCSSIWSTALVKPLIWAKPRLSGLHGLIKESGSLLGFQLLNYGARQGDNLIIGKLLGPVQLGLYAFAYGQLTRPLSLITGTVSNALVPTIGRIMDDPERLARGVTRAVVLTARLAAPIFVGGAFVAERLVSLLFGDRWETALPLVRIFLLLAAPQALASLLGSVWVAVGSARVLFLWQLAVTPVFLLVFAGAGYLGGSSLAVGIAYAVTSAALMPAVFWISHRVAGLQMLTVVRSLARLTLDLLLMGLAVGLLGGVSAGAGAPSWLVLILQILTGAATYMMLFRIFSRSELSSLIELCPGAVQPVALRVFRMPS
ncbi:MAG: oligosaccharide flippase family protein [Acidobacteria bacterium]|nr:oligosaccharide flippase family protein [Acidobacteriota bacterium]